MKVEKHLQIRGSSGRPILWDAYRAESPRAWVVFAHGIKGFKDWGHWWALGRTFAQKGISFFPFNFSMGGTTPEEPHELTELEAFSQNTFSQERADLLAVMEGLAKQEDLVPASIRNNLFLIGHSRGGPICLSAAVSEKEVAGLITWASVSSLDYAWPDDDFIARWREKGYYSIVNRRTNQEMTIRFSLYEDYRQNLELLETASLAPQLDKPYLILHGDRDEAVPVSAAEKLHQWSPDSQLQIIPGGDHVFGGRHPWEREQLPPASQALAEASIGFIQENCPAL